MRLMRRRQYLLMSWPLRGLAYATRFSFIFYIFPPSRRRTPTFACCRQNASPSHTHCTLHACHRWHRDMISMKFRTATIFTELWRWPSLFIAELITFDYQYLFSAFETTCPYAAFTTHIQRHTDKRYERDAMPLPRTGRRHLALMIFAEMSFSLMSFDDWAPGFIFTAVFSAFTPHRQASSLPHARATLRASLLQITNRRHYLQGLLKAGLHWRRWSDCRHYSTIVSTIRAAINCI